MRKNTSKRFVVSGLEDLSDRVESAASARRASAAVSEQEISHVAGLDRRLFPDGFELDHPNSEMYRRLAILSQSELRPVQITSHRRYIGKLIVFAKRCTWPLLKVHLEKRFRSLDEFSRTTVYQLARQHVEIRDLRQETLGNNR